MLRTHHESAITAGGSDAQVVVIGAGVAGLTCAIELHRAGRNVLVLEKDSKVGGRVQSYIVDDFIIDRGFQVLFTAYPTLGEYLDPGPLNLRRFDPAARIVADGNVSRVGDALAQPSLLLDTVTAGSITLGDKLRLLSLRNFARHLNIDECFESRFALQSSREFLLQRGFSNSAISNFFSPFYGGILLDRSLGTSASVLLFTFKMLSEGATAIPSAGMGEITRQLASMLPENAVRLNTTVTSLGLANERIAEVRLADGSTVKATTVVLATDAPTVMMLAKTAGETLNLPKDSLGCTTLYYSSAKLVLPGKTLWLNAGNKTHRSPRLDAVATASISHAINLTQVAAEYDLRPSPARSLLSVTAVGPAAELDDEKLDHVARRDLGEMLSAAGAKESATQIVSLKRVAVCRVPYAQFAQPPGSIKTRPVSATKIKGVWLASEVVHSSSLEGAARGGKNAARAIISSTP